MVSSVLLLSVWVELFGAPFPRSKRLSSLAFLVDGSCWLGLRLESVPRFDLSIRYPGSAWRLMAQFLCACSALCFSSSTLNLKAIVMDWESGAFCAGDGWCV